MRRLLAGALLVGALAACGTRPAAQPITSPEDSAGPESSVSPEPPPSQEPTATARKQRTAEQVVAELLDALGESSERAWPLLSAASQRSFGSYQAFQDLETDYAEGLAQFAEADSATLDLGAGAQVVTVSGQISREGETEADAAALAVRAQDGELRVDLPAPTEPLAVAVEVPEHGEEVTSGAELRAIVPAQSEPAAAVDGEVQQVRAEPADGDRLLVTLSPRLAPGQHVLTVAAVRADGVVVADAVVFRVS